MKTVRGPIYNDGLDTDEDGRCDPQADAYGSRGVLRSIDDDSHAPRSEEKQYHGKRGRMVTTMTGDEW